MKILTSLLAAICVLATSKPSFAGNPGELTQNGGFEAGDTSGWQYFPSSFSDFTVTPNSYAGAFAAELFNPNPNSSAVIQQANLAVGAVNPGDTFVISFAAKSVGSNDAFAFAEFLSNIGGGGTSSTEILGGGPLPLTPGWQTFTFIANAGPDVSGGVTLRFAAVTGFDAYSFIDLFIDEASVRTAVVPSINYCDAAPNSVSATGAHISHTGSVSIAANDLTLAVIDAPPAIFGIFYYGDAQIQVPFGDGFRCVGGSLHRLNPPQSTSGAGSATRFLDFTQPPAGIGPGAILPGDTRYMQYWYRDPLGAGAGFNLSDGLLISFLP